MSILSMKSTSISTGTKSSSFWDQDTAQGAMVPIATVNFNNNVTFNFGQIPQNYQDLMIVINGYSNNAAVLVMDDFNLGSPTCSYTSLISNGTTVTSERLGANTAALPVTTSASPNIAGVNSFIIHVLNYTNSTTFKPVLSRKVSETSGSGTQSLQIGMVQTTAPLTYFKFSTQNGANFFTRGVATLYGIKAGA